MAIKGPKNAKNEREWERIDVASMWHRCDIDVASMRIDVALMCIDVASKWHRCGIDMD